MSIHFKNDWELLLQPEFSQSYYTKLHKFLFNEYKTKRIFPQMYDIFNAFHYTSYKDTKVCILGQDPYHGANQAHGLCFSVKPEVSIPPSLKNIYKELNQDIHCPIPSHGYLKHWADQGVLMLNAVLTVRSGEAASHRGQGWENFTDHVLTMLNDREQPVVFILWGAFAQSKIPMITNNRHYIIQSPHPSPLSAHRGFFGSQPFSKANSFLISNEISPIDWSIPPLEVTNS